MGSRKEGACVNIWIDPALKGKATFIEQDLQNLSVHRVATVLGS